MNMSKWYLPQSCFALHGCECPDCRPFKHTHTTHMTMTHIWLWHIYHVYDYDTKAVQLASNSHYGPSHHPNIKVINWKVHYWMQYFNVLHVDAHHASCSSKREPAITVKPGPCQCSLRTSSPSMANVLTGTASEGPQKISKTTLNPLASTNFLNISKLVLIFHININLNCRQIAFNYIYMNFKSRNKAHLSNDKIKRITGFKTAVF